MNVLLLSGSMGAGKTTVLGEITDLLAEANIPHAAIDFDAICHVYPTPAGDPHGQRLGLRNLAHMVGEISNEGVRYLIIARVVEEASELDGYRAAIPGAEITVCLLTASIETMAQRLRLREPGMTQAQQLARSFQLDDILARAAVEDFSVDNDGRAITVVAREVLVRAGWLPA